MTIRWQTVVLAALVVSPLACHYHDTAACRARCASVSGDGTSAMCTTLCTRPCPELVATFGIDPVRCRWFHEGGPVPPAASSRR